MDRHGEPARRAARTPRQSSRPRRWPSFWPGVETVMPLHGTAGGTRTSGGKGSSEEIVRDAAGLVCNGRERFLTSCVWRAANALHQAKIDITTAELADSAWALFTDPQRGAVLDDGKWKKSDAVYKAKLTMRRLDAGKVDLGPKVEQGAATPDVVPTHPDTSVPVDEARAALKAALQAHFAAATGQRALRISTGTGKTRAAVEAVAEDIERRRSEGDKSATLYLVPTLALADEIAELFRQHGVDAQVFRGRAADDPDAPGVKMCHDLEAVNLALKLGATVSKACCKLKDPTVGKLLFCPFYDACSYQRQLTEEPDVWVASHEMLFTAPSGMGEIGSLVVDEGFAQGGVRIAKRGITLDEVGAEPTVGRNNFEMLNHADIAGWRGRPEECFAAAGKDGRAGTAPPRGRRLGCSALRQGQRTRMAAVRWDGHLARHEHQRAQGRRLRGTGEREDQQGHGRLERGARAAGDGG